MDGTGDRRYNGGLFTPGDVRQFRGEVRQYTGQVEQLRRALQGQQSTRASSTRSCEGSGGWTTTASIRMPRS